MVLIKELVTDNPNSKIFLNNKYSLEDQQRIQFSKYQCFPNIIKYIKHQHKSRYFRFINKFILALLLLTTGCVDRETLLKEISEFDKSVKVGSEGIAAYYTSLNEEEIKTYLLILELNPSCEIGDRVNYRCIDPNWQRNEGKWYDSPLKKPPIPLESIQARIDLLKELTAYSKALAGDRSGDRAGEQFQGNITTLKSRLESLEKKFQTLQGQAENNNNPDSTITKRYINPIGTIVGILGKVLIQEAQWSEIRQSILEAEQPVNTVLTEIAKDLDDYAYLILSTGANERYSLLIDYYNDNRLQLDRQKRAALLAEILQFKTAYDLAVQNKPSQIPNDLKESHTALVKVAKSDGALKDISELRAWLERFKDDAQQLKNAIKQF